MPEKLFGRTLVIRGGALGDFLLTLPAVESLRDASSRLEILAYPQFAELARVAGLVHAGRSIEYGPLAGFFARDCAHDPGLRDYFSSFDLVVSYLFDPDGIFAQNLRASGVERMVAGPHKPGLGAHAIDQLAGPLTELGLALTDRTPKLRLPGFTPQPSLVAIHPGSGSRDKNWPAANWKILAGELLARHPALRLAIIGGEADAAALDVLGGLRAEQRAVFLENLPLVELARNLAGAQAYLGHDTGVSHLATALGIPSLLLFGPTDPAVWAPLHHSAQVLRAPEENLSNLGPSTVMAAAAKHLLPRLLA